MAAIKAKQLDTSGIVERDAAPVLAADLDVTNKKIKTTSTNTNIKLEPNGSGVIEIMGAGGNDGTLQLNCSVNNHGVKIKSPPHSAAASYTLTLPEDTGTNGQILKTDPNGQLSWVDYDGALTYKGTVTLSGYNTTPPASITGASKGDFFIISGEGYFAGATNKKLRDGDHIVFNQDVGGSLSNAKFDIIDNTGLIDGFQAISGATATLVPRKVFYFSSSVVTSTTLTLPDSDTLTTGDIIKLVWVYAVGNAQEELTVTFQGGLGKPGFDYRAFGSTAMFNANAAGASTDLKTRGQSITLIYDGNDDKFYAEIGTRFLGQLLDLDLGTNAPAGNDFLKYDGSKWIPGVPDIITDSTPQLGGHLDVNGKDIVSTSNGDIVITPNGNGNIVLDGLNWPQADGNPNQILKTDGSGQLSFVDSSGGSRPIRHTETSATSLTIGGGAGTNAAIGADELERLYIITTTTGDITVTLPSAVGLDRFKLQIKSATSRTVKIKTASGQDIDGTDYSTTSSLDISTQYNSYTLVSDNADWYII